MRYTDTVDRSAELLRQAIPLMSRQAAALHPVSYAVWYEYVANSNPSLKHAVDDSVAELGRLDEARTYALYRKHVADIDPLTAEKVVDGFDRVLTSMSDSASRAGSQTERYVLALEGLRQDLPDEATGPVADVLRHSAEMAQAVARLQAQLADSRREILDLRSEVHRTRHESLVDALTGLANRRAFDQRLATSLLEAPRLPGPDDAGPCLIVTDIDHFKRINDTYGHAFGDHVLKAVAQTMKSAVSDRGFVARIGGEEFAILLPASTLAQAQALAEQVRSTIASSRVRRNNAETLERITVSLGVAAGDRETSGLDLLSRADAAMYSSKQSGRDRVTVAK